MSIILAKLKLNTGRRFESFDPSSVPNNKQNCYKLGNVKNYTSISHMVLSNHIANTTVT
jgi:hypothetical protein